MTCRFGQAHPPFGLKQPQKSASGLDGCLHCFKCWHTNNKRTIDAHWLEMNDRVFMVQLLQTGRLCKLCFPPPTP